MPLFECSKCRTIENTALSNYWVRVTLEKKEALCSECDPDIGKWHDEFPKTTVEDYNRAHPKCPVEYPLSGGQPL